MILRRIAAAAALLCLVLQAEAGLFLFAEPDQEPLTITHPTGYTGGQNQHLEISVCLDPNSESLDKLEIPVRNAITVWNRLEPTLGNVIQPNPEMEFTAFDVESVLLHEVGHCIGLAHPNLATESGLSDSDERGFAKTLRGPNNTYDLDAGADNVIGTRDDLRGDDINLNWFETGVNDPFGMPAVIDNTTYTTDAGQLPGGHSWVEIAGRSVWEARGLPPSVAVMFQGIFNSETRRALNHDDAAMIRLGMTGRDRTQGTDRDYTFELQYGGVANNCDINISMQGSSFGFCQVGASGGGGLPPNHWRITSATIQIASESEINWHFNNQLLGDNLIFQDRFEEDP